MAQGALSWCWVLVRFSRLLVCARDIYTFVPPRIQTGHLSRAGCALGPMAIFSTEAPLQRIHITPTLVHFFSAGGHRHLGDRLHARTQCPNSNSHRALSQRIRRTANGLRWPSNARNRSRIKVGQAHLCDLFIRTQSWIWGRVKDPDLAPTLSVYRVFSAVFQCTLLGGRRPCRSVLIIELIIAWGISDRSGSSTNQRPPPTSCYPPHSPPPLGCLLRVTTSTMPIRLESIPLRGQSFSRFSTPFCCRTTSGGPPGTRHMSSSSSPSSAQVSR
jgi:hypothetical protein